VLRCTGGQWLQHRIVRSLTQAVEAGIDEWRLAPPTLRTYSTGYWTASGAWRTERRQKLEARGWSAEARAVGHSVLRALASVLQAHRIVVFARMFHSAASVLRSSGS
jgi:hypothetical protein